jgi:hypothetical protein
VLGLALYYGDAVQVALVFLSAVLAIVSVNAYRKRPEARYLLLMLAFSLLCLASAGTAVMELFAGLGPAGIELMEIYLIPSLELLMVVSFLVAVLWSAKQKRRLGMAFLGATIAVGLAASAFYVAGSPALGPQAVLPAGCSRPTGGFLIIASSMGYNDSIVHGAPVKSWPVLDVTKGTDVDITVCNTYSEPVGFQVTHYLVSKVESIAPGRVMTVSFLANQTGTFEIYCAIFNPIHIYLQGGQLNVM